jgi:hypothetical protein
MKTLIKRLTFLLAVSLPGCMPNGLTREVFLRYNAGIDEKGTEYQYTYRMTKPIESDSFKYSERNVDFNLYITSKSIGFTIQNKSEGSVELLWDKCAMVIDGNTDKVFHVGVKYQDRAISQPPAIIPPMSRLTDEMFPISYVTDVNPYGALKQSLGFGGRAFEWNSYDIFFTHDADNDSLKEAIPRNVGKKLGALFTLKDGERERSYYFEFEITKVVPKSPVVVEPKSSIPQSQWR